MLKGTSFDQELGIGLKRVFVPRDETEPRRFCIIGSGLSGLSAAFFLSQYGNTAVSVYERDAVFGGRANITPDGEHCPRVFLSDYTCLLGILRTIKAADGVSIADRLQPVNRFCYTAERGWHEISHLYLTLASEVPLRQRLRMLRQLRKPLLVAEHDFGPNTNRYGSLRNYSAMALAQMAGNLLRSRRAFALDGPTDEHLTNPWIEHLRRRGVVFQKDKLVHRIRPFTEGVDVQSDNGWEKFDAVVVATFVSDLTRLLSASGIDHSVRQFRHSHCASFTITLHPDEPILVRDRLALYCRDGINLILQPRSRRCVVLCTKSSSTDPAYVVSRVREFLNLAHPVDSVRMRDNLRPEEAVYAAEYVRPDRILRRTQPRVQFAGSYLYNSYPIDSGEGAARTAFNAAHRLRLAFDLPLGSTARKTVT
jgi:glycine/D-amino acid oxidase-like deaminating enzyme